MSRIAILGASGQLGDHLLSEGLEAGWLVHALSRDPSKIRKTNERLTIFQGDTERGEGLEALVTGCRYIIYAVDSTRPEDCVAHLVHAVGWKVVERIIFVSRPGAATVSRTAKAVGALTAFLPKALQPAQHNARAEELLRVSGLPYCVFRVTGLTDEPHGQELVITEGNEAPPGSVGRADLARFIIKSLGDRSWNLREVTVGAKRRMQ
jgi:uncharacterized protein YbjT (DUF2867 family)